MKKVNSQTVLRVVVMLFLVLVVIPLLPILISGRWGWWEAWTMAAIFILTFIVSRAIARKKNLDILVERAHYNQHQNTQPWDKWLSPVVAFGSVFMLLIPGFDALFHWSVGFTLPVELTGLVLILAGFTLASYAFIENAFFSGTVRIQGERGHRVISSGPHGWMRHPGYMGSLISHLGIPLLLDSAWAFIPGLVFGDFLRFAPAWRISFYRKICRDTRNMHKKCVTACFPGSDKPLSKPCAM
jgi:protein-S-isoprenylcysteine O-methyltransferase Ste14